MVPSTTAWGRGCIRVHGCDSRGQQQEPSGVPEDQGWRAFPQQGPKGLDSEASEALRCWQGSPAPHHSAGPCSGPSLLLQGGVLRSSNALAQNRSDSVSRSSSLCFSFYICKSQVTPPTPHSIVSVQRGGSLAPLSWPHPRATGQPWAGRLNSVSPSGK